MRHKSGAWVWVLDRGRVIERSADGRALRACGTHLDITERKEAEQALIAARAEADEATTARERFLANISHELRTPLNAIVGLSHHLKRTPTSEEQRRSIDGITFSADNLLGVINDLLDLTRIRAGHMELDEIAFGVRTMLDGLVNSLQGTARLKGLSLSVHVDPLLPEALIGDPVRLNQVLANLIGNALKFTSKGSVDVVVMPTTLSGAPAFRVSVTDTGIGIPPADLARVFDPFLQSRAELTRSLGGTGLGLSIVRELVRQMHGEITLESEVSVGTTFHLTLPLRAAPASSTEAPEIEEIGEILAGLRVLVVEDNDMNSLVARLMLERAGASVVIAVNGRLAVERLREERFDLALMDIQMPEMDGFEATFRIRNDLGLSEAELPIIALTASALADEQRRAQASGMTDYILKPFKPDTLCVRIAQILARNPSSRARLPLVAQRLAPRSETSIATTTAPASAPVGDPTLLRGRRILLVEDNEMNRRVATLFLAEAGAQVTEAVDGLHALDELRASRFDLVLMDIQMPGMDGFETTRCIREDLGLTPAMLPIVALTATALTDELRRTQAAGMTAYILKPFHPDLLCSRVAELLLASDDSARTIPAVR